MFGHFHAHWREPVNRDRRSVHAGASKVTESGFPIDVQREMRLRTKGGHRFVGLRCASRQHRTLLTLVRQSMYWWVFPRVM